MSERTTEQHRGSAANLSDGEARDTKPLFKELPSRPIKARRGIRNLDPKLLDKELPNRPIKAGRSIRNPDPKLLDKELPNRPITGRRGIRNRPKPPAP